MKKNKLFYLLLFFILGIVLFSLSFFQIDPDYLWHIKAGEYMFHNGLLKHDVFSWYVSSKYWFSHEWFFEILLYSMKYILGNYHLFFYCFICLLFLGVFPFLVNKEDYLKNIPFTLVWTIIFCLIGLNMQARPHLLSYCLLSVTIYLLRDNYLNVDSQKIYFLPLISIIWANVHGGSSNLPYLLCFLFMIVGCFSFQFSKIEATRISKKQTIRYLIIGICCMIGVCMNLHGFQMFLYPYQNMLDSTMLNNIAEWRSTTLNDPTHYVYFILIIFIFLAMLFSKKKISFYHLVLFGLCVFLGLKSIRFWFYTYIICTYFVFYYIPKWKMERGTELGILLLSIILCCLFIFRSRELFHPSYYKFLDKNDIAMIRSLDSKRLFNMYDYGGELIYYDVKVFIDGRADLYSPYNYSDYLNISMLQGDYVSLLEKYSFDYLLVDKNYPIYMYLKYDDQYELIYSHNKVKLFQKKESLA